MFGRPALFACRLRCKVINNRVIPSIADNIQVGILIHDTHQVFFGIPAVAQDDNISLCRKLRHNLPYHGCRQFQLGYFLFPHTVSQGNCQIDNPLFPPYQNTKHKADKTMPVEVIGTIMCGMVEKF